MVSRYLRVVLLAALCLPALHAQATPAKPVHVKVVVVAMFEPGNDTGDAPGEYQLWGEREHLDKIYALPAGYHHVRMNEDGVLGLLTGEGAARAAASVMALGLDPRFDLTKAYWIVAGKDHPFPLYRKFGVPVALSTDDEGVSRIDLTHEYVRAVETYALGYDDLKQMVRASLEHSFLPGASLWSDEDRFGHPVAACCSDTLGAAKPSQRCSAFLASNEKARQQ